MATIVLKKYLDDLDLQEGREPAIADRTVSFMVDGEYREIDLSEENIHAFNDLLKPYFTASREASPPRRSYKKKDASPIVSPIDTTSKALYSDVKEDAK